MTARPAYLLTLSGMAFDTARVMTKFGPVNYPGPSGVASDAAQHVDLLRGSAHRACRSAGIFSPA